MRVLFVHNRYQIRAGEDEAVDAEMSLLRQHGCDVVSIIETNDRVRQVGNLRAALRAIWSHEAYERVRTALQNELFDVVHVHNFFPLISPAVHFAAKSKGVPSIQTLHNFRLYCACGTFYRDHNICRSCVDAAFPWPAVRYGCYRESRAGSATVATMQVAHRILGTWRNAVTRFVALTQFAKDQFIELGIPADKVVVKPNFLVRDPGPGTGEGGYAVFVGRFSPEKGVDTLLDAWRILGERGISLRMIGDGPKGDAVRREAAASKNIEVLGWRPVEEVFSHIANARMLIFPSEWYEGFPRVLIEAMAMGTPVIGSNIGSIAEIIRDRETGVLFKSGEASDLAQKLSWLMQNPEVLKRMRARARAEFEEKYSPERNWGFISSIYNDAVIENSRSSQHGGRISCSGGMINRIGRLCVKK